MIEHADTLYGRAVDRLTHVPGFAGLGIGLRETSGRITTEPAWRVYVHRKKARRSLAPRERVAERLFDLPTDVIEAALTRCASSSDVPFEGAAIANDCGVPGSLGCMAWLRRTDEPVLLSCYHVLFGRRCRRGSAIWSVGFEATPRLIARVLSGKAGIVVGLDPPTFVDAGTGALADASICAGAPADATAHAAAGDSVTKHGAATGLTHGVVIDIAYPDLWYWEYRSENAPRQILIRSTSWDRPFSRTGDSGAVVRNERGLLGLLWGTTARGEGVASPINAVARALGLRFANTPTAAVS
ncbi:MAG: hypothetical protein H0T47_20960 [Planctomycetaceae bacterium]|nr:hypothetical protein [Planctomycetaceae bacterium]